MTQADREKEALYSQLRSIESDLSSASGAISDVESKIAYVEASMGSLPSRLMAVRGQGYAAMAHLEKSIELLTKKWMEAAPTLKQAFHDSVQPITAQIRALQAEAQRLRREIDSGNIGFSRSLAIRLSIEVSSIKMRANIEAGKVSVPLNEFASSVNAIERDLKVAEKTMKLFSTATFLLKQAESPVLAIEGRIMTGEKWSSNVEASLDVTQKEGFQYISIHVHIFIKVPQNEKDKIPKIIDLSHKYCPISKAIKGNVNELVDFEFID